MSIAESLEIRRVQKERVPERGRNNKKFEISAGERILPQPREVSSLEINDPHPRDDCISGIVPAGASNIRPEVDS
jgi:hypothetical protein